MAANLVPFFLHAHHDIRVLLGGSTYYKKRSLHLVIAKNVQYLWRIDRIRPVIDGDGNLRPVPISMLQVIAGRERR